MFPVSYRDLELMLLDRGVEVDHTTIFRWIQAYAAELEKRIRRHLRMSNGSWRVDETYVRVKNAGRISIGRWTAEGGRSISFRVRGGIPPWPSGSFARPSRNRISPIREPSPSTRILPIPERSQICKATVSYRAAPVCGNANTSTPSSSKITGASSALSGLGSASAVSTPRGELWRVSKRWR
jgi:hypothetical protein